MVSFKEFLGDLKEAAKKEIKALAKSKLENFEKKEKLDAVIKSLVEKVLSKAGLNVFLKFILKKMFLPYIADITQLIYDFVKMKINGVTLSAEEK